MTTKTEGHKQYPNTRPGCPHMDIMLSCTISPTFSGIYMYVSWEWAWGLYNISLPAFNFAIWDREPGDQTNECMNPYILALGCSLNLDQSQGNSLAAPQVKQYQIQLYMYALVWSHYQNGITGVPLHHWGLWLLVCQPVSRGTVHVGLALLCCRAHFCLSSYMYMYEHEDRHYVP